MAASGAAVPYPELMEALGFYRSGRPTENVYSSYALQSDDKLFERRVKYRAVLDPERLGATDIFELSGAPCIYFKTIAREPSPEEIDAWHRVAWNHGLAPMLWVVSPTQVQILDCFSARPIPAARRGPPDWILHLRDLSTGLQSLQERVGRRQVESRGFWDSGVGKGIDRGNRVDSALLQDLGDAAAVLEDQGLHMHEAHKLLLRAIFLSYLESRGILTVQRLKRLFGVGGFAEALGDPQTTEALFSWMTKTFNGDLFLPRQGPRRAGGRRGGYSKPQLEVVRFLLEGGNPKTRQKFLWPYQFDVIPVELISSIYEKFTHAADGEKAKEHSTHYTPMNVVNLMLSQVFDDELFSADLPLDAKAVDLACGSGVFLVECLRRLVGRRVARGQELSRRLIRETLYRQIYGVDVNPEAIRIAALSLYLGALEMEEGTPDLDQDLAFQPLICEPADGQMRRNLLVGDAFDSEGPCRRWAQSGERPFAVVVGNPPWKPWKAPPGEKDPSYVDFCKAQDPPLPLGYHNPPDQAFLWLASRVAAPSARVGMVLHAQRFFSHDTRTRQAKRALMSQLAPRVLFNLSALRQERLFPTSAQPAVVFVAENREPEPREDCVFAAPDRCRSFRRHGLLEIGPELVKRLPVRRVAEDEVFLKVATWGTARDLSLVDRLRAEERFRRLGDLVRDWGWPDAGRGVHKGGKGSADKLPKRLLDKGGLTPAWLDVPKLPVRAPAMKINRGGKRPEIYQAPVLIVTRGIRQGRVYGALASQDVLYTKQYVGFPAKARPAWRVHYLNGILSSSMASYLLFLTCGAWGVERDVLEKIDWEDLRVPDPAAVDRAARDRFCGQVKRLYKRVWQPRDLPDVWGRLDQAVFDLYGLSRSERVLVEDCISLTIDRHYNRASKAFQPPKPKELREYAEHFIEAVASFIPEAAHRTVVADIPVVGGAPLQAVHFRVQTGGAPLVNVQERPDLREVLDEIATRLPAEVTPSLFSRRHVRVYGDGELFIIKPRELRFWSRSAGLSDADAVLSEHVRRAFEADR